jgi:hypothetical protein
VENPVALPANFTFFNVLLLFALFQCSRFFCTVAFSRGGGADANRKGRKIRSLGEAKTEILAGSAASLRIFDRMKTN